VISTDPKVNQCLLTEETNARRCESSEKALNIFSTSQLLSVNSCNSCRARKVKCDRRTPCRNCLKVEGRECNYPKELRRGGRPRKGAETSFHLSTSLDIPGEHPTSIAELVVNDSPYASKLGDQITSRERYPYILEARSNSQFCKDSIPSQNRAGNSTSGQTFEEHQGSITTDGSENELFSYWP